MFRNFLYTLITLMLFTLWLLPVWVIVTYGFDYAPFAWLYAPVIIMSLLWGWVIDNTYF